mgnify:CR=1 FL=1
MLEQVAAFLAASLIVIVVPGPDMMLVFRNTARAGRSGAAWTAAGIMTGLAVLATAAALGLTALLAAAPTLFTIVQIAGGLYLVYLGTQAVRSYLRLRSQRAMNDSPDPSLANQGGGPVPAGSRWTSFRQGLLCNLLNPKVAAFYLSLFPQFDLAPLPSLTQHIVLAAAFWLLCLIWYIGLVGSIGRAARLLQSPTFARRTEGTAGVVLTALGGLVLAQSVT